VDSLVQSYRRWENPVLARLPLLVGDFLQQKGDAEGAESALRLGNAAHPGHPALLVALGGLLVALGKGDEAKRWLRAAVSMDASCHEAWFELSFLLAEDGDLEGARHALATAVSLRPLFPDYRYQYGILARDLGRPREAIEELSRVHLLNPRSAYCSLHLAEAHLEVGELDEALWVLQEGSPRDLPEALVVAARMRLRCGDRDEAQKLLEKVLECGYSHEDSFAVLDALRAPTAKPPGTVE
jgi:tetratricopeptide (TPR) repeat protein